MLAAVRERGSAPVSIGSLVVFRVLFGAIVAFLAVRALVTDTLHEQFARPTFFFRYPGFEFVPVGGVDDVRVAVAVCAVCGVLIALGACTRAALVVWCACFLWVELIDVTNYLNHHWLLWCLGVLLAASPCGGALSLDAVFRPSCRRDTVPRGLVWLFRVQVGVVYVGAAIAKVGTDWLCFGAPLSLWLPARDSLPVIGPILDVPSVPLLASWCGFLYDATIVLWLSLRRTRALAYVAVVVFHVLTRAFFEIGVFPLVMISATLLFFAPDFPDRARHAIARRFAPSTSASSASSAAPQTWTMWSTMTAVAAGLWLALQLALPARMLVFADHVLWDETAMRFSWRVMVREKSGTLTYRVRSGARVVEVTPHDLLTWRQANEMIGQPDLIAQLARHLRAEHEARGATDVSVTVDARISLNGRPLAPFIDPSVDLSRVDLPFFGRPTFVLPPPTTSPPTRHSR